jgi:lycopene cyclase domain-containing protein
MKTEYLIVLGCVLVFPLILSILMPLRLYTRWRSMLFSMGTVCSAYWAWDVIVTARGHWSFNPDYVLGITLLDMPIEEWLFFIVITFVSIFTYEAVRMVTGRRIRR